MKKWIQFCGVLGWSFAAMIVVLPETAEAQFCALRQPVVAFQTSFGDGVSMCSFDREVTEAHREQIAEVLPFTLHHRELGTHTLYAGMDATESVQGYLHVRSERDRWGLTELAWQIGPDLRIMGVQVQRTRSSGKVFLESAQFRNLVKGKGLAELRTLLKEDGGDLTDTVKTQVGSENAGHAEMAVRSALKTLLATALVWDDVLASHGFKVPENILEGAGTQR